MSSSSILDQTIDSSLAVTMSSLSTLDQTIIVCDNFNDGVIVDADDESIV
jgi:hypothetical protein